MFFLILINFNGLICVDTAGLRNSAAIEMLQDQTQMMLQEYCTAPAQSFAANVTSRHSMLSSRFGKLLLLLPAFRSVRDASVRHLFFRQLIGDVPITRLLADVMGTFWIILFFFLLFFDVFYSILFRGWPAGRTGVHAYGTEFGPRAKQVSRPLISFHLIWFDLVIQCWFLVIDGVRVV